MLGIFFIYFIGNRYYTLAKKHQKEKWVFAFLGLILYYLPAIVLLVMLMIINELVGLGFDVENEIFLNVFAIVVGLISVIVTYNLLKKKWEKEASIKEDDIFDIGKK